MREDPLFKAFQTPIGEVWASYRSDALVSLSFDKEDKVDRGYGNKLHEELSRQLMAYFEGRLTEFDIPIAPQGTEFQQRVWSLLRAVGYSKTKTYLDLSKEYGDENAIRAIASANGANPIMILIPCHRIIGSDGSLTGYAGGLWRKEALLDLERGVKRLF